MVQPVEPAVRGGMQETVVMVGQLEPVALVEQRVPLPLQVPEPLSTQVGIRVTTIPQESSNSHGRLAT